MSPGHPRRPPPPRPKGPATPAGTLREVPAPIDIKSTGTLPTRAVGSRRLATGQRPAILPGSTSELLRLASNLPIEDGAEAIARAICEVARDMVPDCGFGARLPAEGEDGEPLNVIAPPLLSSVADDRDTEPAEAGANQRDVPDVREVRDMTEGRRLFPWLEHEWILELPHCERSTIHVAGPRARMEGDAEKDLDRLVNSASLLLASGLRAWDHVRATQGAAAQLRELQAEIVHSEKLASVGQIAAKVVHELNNPLTAIVSYADFLTKKLGRAGHDSSDVERLRRIGESAERILRLSRDLTAFARPDEETPAPVAIHEVLERAVVFCEHTVSEHRVKISMRLDPDTPSIYGMRGQLTQVFVNLITNACHAIHDAGRSSGGEIEITTRPTPEGGAEIVVGDNGNGISPENVVRVFDPFFTTKPAGRGTGLGLSIVRSLVEAHGGRIWVRSIVGRGTQFVVQLLQRGRR